MPAPDKPKPPLEFVLPYPVQGNPPTEEELTETLCFDVACAGVTVETALASVDDVKAWLESMLPEP